MRVCLRVVLLFAVLAMTAAAQAEMVGHWTFDEGSGTTAFDSSGKGYNGTISGATYTTGKIGSGALLFDGTAHVEVPGTVETLLYYTDYTMAFWVKQDYSGTQEAAQIYIGSNDMSDYVGGYAIYKLTSAENAIADANAPGGVSEPLNFTKPASDVWTHVAVTLDGTTRTVYINGVADASRTSGQIGYDGGYGDPVWFGALHGYDIYHLKGCMDDIRLYTHALSATEVAGLVPEPSVLLLLASGMIGLFACNWRKRK